MADTARRAVAELAASQHRAFTRKQAAAVGFDRPTRRYRVAIRLARRACPGRAHCCRRISHVAPAVDGRRARRWQPRRRVASIGRTTPPARWLRQPAERHHRGDGAASLPARSCARRSDAPRPTARRLRSHHGRRRPVHRPDAHLVRPRLGRGATARCGERSRPHDGEASIYAVLRVDATTTSTTSGRHRHADPPAVERRLGGPASADVVRGVASLCLNDPTVATDGVPAPDRRQVMARSSPVQTSPSPRSASDSRHTAAGSTSVRMPNHSTRIATSPRRAAAGSCSTSAGTRHGRRRRSCRRSRRSSRSARRAFARRLVSGACGFLLLRSPLWWGPVASLAWRVTRAWPRRS